LAEPRVKKGRRPFSRKRRKKEKSFASAALTLKEVWFGYEKKGPA
jgi:hypothetical protein